MINICKAAIQVFVTMYGKTVSWPEKSASAPSCGILESLAGGEGYSEITL
jgi:hypothetical protein